MYQLYTHGTTLQQIADRYDISRQRVAQIIANYTKQGTVTDNEARHLHRTQLEGLRDELIAMFFEPPPPMYDVKGNMLIDENGEPVRDIEIKLKTADYARKLSESIRRMDATDLPRQRYLSEDEAMSEVRKFLAKVDHGLKNQPVITVEVLDDNLDLTISSSFRSVLSMRNTCHWSCF
jgi:hypothetical protein